MGDRDWRFFLYGGLASITAEFGTFPLDTAKTRLQIQGQTIDKAYSQLRFNGMTDFFLKTTKQQGFSALYAGIWPAVLRQATYGTIKFGTYYSLKRLIEKGETDVATNIFCAVVAGMMSSAIANPTDVLKVRMQVMGVHGNRSLYGCFLDIYRNEGIAGLWRGVGPTSQRAAVIAAVELPVYDMCKHHLKATLGDVMANHFISSLIASLGSAVASTPIDVIRTRLMNQRRLLTASVNNPIYRGSVDCFVQTVQHEGLKALYKGFIPTWLRMGPWNIIFFITYEQLKQLY